MTHGRPVPRPWEEVYRRQGRLYRGVRLDPWTEDTIQTFPALKQGTWFDAGCGDGKGLVPLTQWYPDATIVAADRAIWGLRRTREAMHGARLDASHLLRGDARAWPIQDQSFDAIRLVHVAGHVSTKERPLVVAEAHRLLRPGGILIATDFGRGDFRYGKGRGVEPHMFERSVGIRTHYTNAEETTKLLEGAAFVDIETKTETFTVTYHGKDLARERIHSRARRQPA